MFLELLSVLALINCEDIFNTGQSRSFLDSDLFENRDTGKHIQG